MTPQVACVLEAASSTSSFAELPAAAARRYHGSDRGEAPLPKKN